MRGTVDALSAAVRQAHTQAGLLVQMSPFWSRLAAARARSCDLVSQLGPMCGKSSYCTYFTKSKSVHTLKGLALPQAPVLFAHAVVTEIKIK